jgi:hypothetical protein
MLPGTKLPTNTTISGVDTVYTVLAQLLQKQPPGVFIVDSFVVLPAKIHLNDRLKIRLISDERRQNIFHAHRCDAFPIPFQERSLPVYIDKYCRLDPKHL